MSHTGGRCDLRGYGACVRRSGNGGFAYKPTHNLMLFIKHSLVLPQGLQV